MKDTKQTLLELKEIIEDMIERLDEPPSEPPPLPEKMPDTEPPPSGGKGRFAIVVGHTGTAPGACAGAPIFESEYPWNRELAAMIASEGMRQGHVCGVFLRDGIGVPGAYAQVEAFHSDAVVELHFNAATGHARGTETLRGIQPEAAKWAECVHESMVGLYKRLGKFDRGIKRLRAGDRGHQSVSQLENIPSVIIEPFFGDNPEDAQLGQANKKALAEALAGAFDRFMQSDLTPGRSGGGQGEVSASVRLPARLRLEMGARIVQFEARRDAKGRIAVYHLPRADGGGTYEIAGINERYHPEKVRHLHSLIVEGRHGEAEIEAARYIARYTDRVESWMRNPGVEFYLRDSAFNRGPGGAAKIFQIALEVPADGQIGPITREAATLAEAMPREFLQKLRIAREEYELRYIGRRLVFWEGLNKRWNKALEFAEKLVDMKWPEGGTGEETGLSVDFGRSEADQLG